MVDGKVADERHPALTGFVDENCIGYSALTG
jgi:hypothetical protein